MLNRSHIHMVKPSDFETGIYRFDGSSLTADVTEQSLTLGTYITKVVFHEGKGDLIFTMSDGSTVLVQNFLQISSLEIVAQQRMGPVGTSGVNGVNGKDGRSGVQGTRGDQGPVGGIGADGFVGPIGPKGEYGVDGPQGQSGESGNIGHTGTHGIRGVRGILGESGADGKTNVFFGRFQPDASTYVGVKNPLWIGV